MKSMENMTGLEVAVIGMAGRFPGANDIHAFWNNLANGVESITFFSDAELLEAGVDPQLIKNPDYVPAQGVLSDLEYFDAAFFGYTPREAELMDPQLRIMLECAVHAMEDAGYYAEKPDVPIGLFAGATPNLYWELLAAFSKKTRIIGEFAAEKLMNKDYLCSQISHKLNLTGPSLALYTACSTSLVAIHMACQALLNGECEMALAGGITTVPLPDKTGYLHSENMVWSGDGHTRAFDAQANGVVGGKGGGMVMLKRLEDAVNDRDSIYAIVKGSAINNDGQRKPGFTAPSVEGQSEVIQTALHLAEVEASSISYLETHGSATVVGDPVEVAALKAVFGAAEHPYCGIGSVKTNIGHLDCGAGVASFIKTVLALKQRQIPPSLNFKTPNPELGLPQSPFYVNTQLKEWPTAQLPLRAGVSSFGIGGTNAHVVLEAMPELTEPLPTATHQLLLLSAQTPAALESHIQNLKNHFIANPTLNLTDVAYTLRAGRRAFKHRARVVCDQISMAVEAFSTPDSPLLRTGSVLADQVKVIFMFGGQGGQYVNMGRDLYENEPFFREEMDRCFALVHRMTGKDLKSILYPAVPDNHLEEALNRTEVTQVVVFIFEFALAKLLLDWGIQPYAMMGYSFGELVAACISGVFTLENALEMVALRGSLMQQLPPGKMLSVPLQERDLIPLLLPNISIAVVNDQSCIVSGPQEAITTFQNQLKKKRLMCIPVNVQHAAHSPEMAPILETFRSKVSQFTLQKPSIPWISNVTGTWIQEAEAMDPGYWANHMRATVRFGDGITKLAEIPNSIFVEIAPGRDLSTMIFRHISHEPRKRIVNLVRHKQKEALDSRYLRNRLGDLWLAGVPIGEKLFSGEGQASRVHLPTYPFQRQRFWIDEVPSELGLRQVVEKGKNRLANTDEYYSTPIWKPAGSKASNVDFLPKGSKVLIFQDQKGLGEKVAANLKRNGYSIVTVKAGSVDQEDSNPDCYTIDPTLPADYLRLFKDLLAKDQMPSVILHLWQVTGAQPTSLTESAFSAATELGYFSLTHIARTIGTLEYNQDLRIDVCTDHMQEVGGEGILHPIKATLLGPIKVIPKEYGNISCRSIDLCLSPTGGEVPAKLVQQLTEAVPQPGKERVIAFRGRYQFWQSFERIVPPPLSESKEEAQDVYLITGGLGGTGLALAEHLSQTKKGKLMLVGRSKFPLKETWNHWLTEHDPADSVSQSIRRIQSMEANGTEVRVGCANVAHPEEVAKVLSEITEKMGSLKGVIHAAGLPDGSLLQRREKQDSTAIFEAKILGTQVLRDALTQERLDFVVLFSSLSALFGAPGQVGYCAANSFLDAYARNWGHESNANIFSVNWDRWQGTGIAKIAEAQHKRITQTTLEGGISSTEAVEAFDRMLEMGLPQIAFTPEEVNLLVTQPDQLEAFSNYGTEDSNSAVSNLYDRPQLDVEYLAPRNERELALANIWQEFLGIKKLGVHDDFFALGVDSLMIITIASRIRRALQVNIPITVFFSRPTIEALANYIEGNQGTELMPSIPSAPAKSYYPVSPAQKRLFVLQEMNRSSTLYNETSIWHLKGKLDSQRLETVLKKLIQRHESLRTSIHLIKGEPVQQVSAQVDFNLNVEEIPAASLPEYTMRFTQPFDLSRAPFLRAALVKTGPESHFLCLDMHHLITDDPSREVLVREIMELYAGKTLSPLTIQYKDFSEWQIDQQESKEMQAHKAYWQSRFSDSAPLLDLPTDFSRPKVKDHHGTRVTRRLDPSLARELKEIAGSENSTLFMFLLSIYHLWLFRLSGQEEIAIGTPINGRYHPDTEEILGMFVNTLVLRNTLNQQTTFKQFVNQIKDSTLKAFEHQAYPFEDLVEQILTTRDTSRNPLFDVWFLFQNNQWQSIDVPGLSVDPVPVVNPTAKFDLTLQVSEEEDTLLFHFDFATQLFTPKTIEKWADYFTELLSTIARNPAANIADLTLLSESGEQEVVETLNQTAISYPNPQILTQRFQEQAHKTPDAIAIVYGSKTITYAHLNEKSARLAVTLVNKGVAHQEIVGVLLPPSDTMVTGIMAILKAGAAFLFIDPELPRTRIAYMLQDSKVKKVLTNSDFEAEMQAGIVAINLEDEANFAPEPSKIPSLTDSLAPAYVIYTSGTTGTPKGVLIHHANLINYVHWFTNFVSINPSDRTLTTSSFAFDAVYTQFFTSLLNGLPLHVIPRSTLLSPGKIWAYIRDQEITFIKVTPSLFSLLISSPAFEPESCRSLRLVVLGGEAIIPQDVEKFHSLCPGIQVMNHYGPTETTIGSVAGMIDFNEWASFLRAPSLGRPISNTRAYVLDPQLRPTPIGVPGELCIGGAGVGLGYLNQSVLTEKQFIPSPFTPDERIYRTGDLAKWGADGKLYGLGRIDRQVKIHGYRIELGEIENQLLKHEQIQEVVVILKDDPEGGRYLCAYLVATEQISISELRVFLGTALPEYMIPAYFVYLEALPLTTHNKLDERSLPPPDLGRSSGSMDYLAPKNSTERQVASIWQEILKRNDFGMNDNFFDLGGNSLGIIKANGRFLEVFGQEIPVLSMFIHPTVSAMANYLDGATNTSEVEEEEGEDSFNILTENVNKFLTDEFE